MREGDVMTTPQSIKEIGYVREIRQRLGLKPNDTSSDNEIMVLSAMRRVGLIAGWNLGDDHWAQVFKGYFESQGLYLTTNPDADGVLP